MEEALLVDLGVERHAPALLAVAVPVPAGEEVREIVQLLGQLRRIGQVVIVLRLELVLDFLLAEDVLAEVQRLGIAVEQHAVGLAVPRIELAHRGNELVGIPVGMLGIGQEAFHRHDIGGFRHEEVAIVPAAGHIGVVARQPAREVGEDLLVQRLDRHLGDVDLAAGLLLPVRHMVFEAVADRRLQDHHVDRRALVGLGLEERHAFRRDRRFIGRLGRRIQHRRARRAHHLRQHRGRQAELRADGDELPATDLAAQEIAHQIAELVDIVGTGHLLLLFHLLLCDAEAASRRRVFCWLDCAILQQIHANDDVRGLRPAAASPTCAIPPAI